MTTICCKAQKADIKIAPLDDRKYLQNFWRRLINQNPSFFTQIDSLFKKSTGNFEQFHNKLP